LVVKGKNSHIDIEGVLGMKERLFLFSSQNISIISNLQGPFTIIWKTGLEEKDLSSTIFLKGRWEKEN